MSKNRNGQGPKYSRYFYAYSDKMIVNDLKYPLMDLDFVFERGLNRYITMGNNLLTIELPGVTGDRNAKYGVILIPSNHLDTYYKNGPAHITRKLSKRELSPSESKLVYLTDFNPNHRALGDEIGFAAELGEKFTCCTIIPYRKAEEKTICELLSESGFNCKGKVACKEPEDPRRQEYRMRTHVHSLGLEERNLEDEFQRLLLKN